MTGLGGVALASLTMGLFLVLSWWRARRFDLARRVMVRRTGAARLAGPGGRLVAAVRDDALRLLGRFTGSDRDLELRLARAGLEHGVGGHRLRQLLGACVGLLGGLVVAGVAVASGRSPLASVLVAAAGVAAGAVVPDVVVSFKVRARAARVRAELPVVAELLALAVVAGAGVTAGLERVARSVDGVLGAEIASAVAALKGGATLDDALGEVAIRTGDAGVGLVVGAVITAVERGTPLADVLHAQASQVRDRARESLMEEGGKREIAMLVPVVLMILPVTIVFALYPGLVAIRLGG